MHKLLLLVVLAMLAIVAVPPTASAHKVCAGHPSDPSIACIRDVDDGPGYRYHTRADVCDRHADGHRVYARLGIDAGGGTWPYYRITGYDTNNANPGCSIYAPGLGSPRFQVSGVAVCIQTEGCGGWQHRHPNITPYLHDTAPYSIPLMN